MSFHFLKDLVLKWCDSEIRIKKYRHPDRRFTTVPFHQGQDISPILLRKIVKDIDIIVKDFLSS